MVEDAITVGQCSAIRYNELLRCEATHIFTDSPEYDILGQLHVNRMARYHVVNRGCMYTTRQTNSYVFGVVNNHQHLSSNYIKTHSQDDHHE